MQGLFFIPRRRGSVIRVAAAAAVLVIVGASAGYRYRQGQAAKEQVMLAMRITGSKLNRIQLQMKAVRP